MKQILFDLMPPATLVAVLLFWSNAPEAWVAMPWTGTIMTFITLGFVSALELVHERHPGWRINRREFLTDIFYLLLMTLGISQLSTFAVDEPLVSLKQRLGIATPWAMELPFVAQVALVVAVIEFAQYWMHRAMHNWRPLWLTHAPHHHITQLNAMKGAVGNPIELFLVGLSVVALLDVKPAALLCGFNLLWVIAGFAHANVRADPPLFYSLFFTTIRNHSLHHSVPYEDTRCNYANSLILLDRIFGTYREGEADLVGQDDRKRLSIREQFLFPFQPLIGAFRNRRKTLA